jgi:hypothetical protein
MSAAARGSMPISAVDPNHFGSEVGQKHRGMRAGPDATEFEDPQTREWAHR